MINVEIVGCEPHRAFHCLVLVSGLRRRPVSSRFCIMVQDEESGQSHYLGHRGWEERFIECREVAAGWDVEKKVLWLLLGPDVVLLLDKKPFVFTLLLIGEKVAGLVLPDFVLAPGGVDGSPIPESTEKGVPATLPPPAHTASRTASPDPAGRPKSMTTKPATEPAATVAEPKVEPRYAPSIAPVAAGVCVVLAAAMGAAYLFTGGKHNQTAGTAGAPGAATASLSAPAPAAAPGPKPADTAAVNLHGAPAPAPVPVPAPKPPVQTAAVTPPPAAPPPVQSAPVQSAAVPPPSAAAPAPVAQAKPAAADAAKPAAPAQVVSAAPALAAPAAATASTTATGDAHASVRPSGGCGGIANPAALQALPATVSSPDAVCIARVWSDAGRVDDAVAALSALQQAGYVPAMLDLAKLYDPLSKRADPPAVPDFARDEYRKVIQLASDDAIKQEAKQRLEALGQH